MSFPDAQYNTHFLAAHVADLDRAGEVCHDPVLNKRRWGFAYENAYQDILPEMWAPLKAALAKFDQDAAYARYDVWLRYKEESFRQRADFDLRNPGSGNYKDTSSADALEQAKFSHMQAWHRVQDEKAEAEYRLNELRRHAMIVEGNGLAAGSVP